jgi:hypothetical protein
MAARLWYERGVRPRGMGNMRHVAARVIGTVCPARDISVALAGGDNPGYAAPA